MWPKGMRRLLWIGMALAALQQWSGHQHTVQLRGRDLSSAGFGVSGIFFNIVITGTINLIFTLAAMTLSTAWAAETDVAGLRRRWP